MAKAKRSTAKTKKAAPKQPEPEQVAAESEPELQPTQEPEQKQTPLDPAVVMQNKYIQAATDRLGGEVRRVLMASYQRKATKATLPPAHEHDREIWQLVSEGSVVYSNGNEWRRLIEDTAI